RSVRSSLLCAVTGLISISSCGAEPLLVLDLDASGIAGTLSTLELHTALGGTVGQVLQFPGDSRRIALYLPGAASGNVEIELSGFEASGCKIALAELSTPVPLGLSHAYELTVPLQPVVFCSLDSKTAQNLNSVFA